MKRSLSILSVILIATMLSGCIISKTPSTSDVSMKLGDPMTFSINVFPSANYTWTLDDTTLSNTGSSYVYTAETGEHTLTVKATHFLGSDSFKWKIQVNSPPVSNAGVDKSIYVDATVTLNGLGSSDPDNDIVSYQWEQTGGTNVTLSNADTVTAQFTANITAGSVLTFELTVTDAIGSTSTDTCMITVCSMIDPITELLSSMVSVPGGTFQMGSTENDQYDYVQYTTPVHEVSLSGFNIGAYEVTQAQYEAIMGTNPSYYQEENGYIETENNPVEQVNYNQALAFCTSLSELTGRTFTLPSEAQWEYASRAGSTGTWFFGDDEELLANYAWYFDNSDRTTHPVGTKLPNNWFLYDIYGNVLEWCLDSWHENYEGAPTDGSAWEPEIVPYHVLRGGFWNSDPWNCRSAHRIYEDQGSGYYYLGFRVVEVLAGS